MNLWTVGCADPRLTAQTSWGKRHALPPPCPQVGGCHKLHSNRQQDRMNLISGNDQTSSRLPAFSLFAPEAVQTIGTTASLRFTLLT